MVFRPYTQITPLVLHTSCRETKSSVELIYIEMFSEKHYFRSSEAKTKSKSSGTSRSFCVTFSKSWLFIYFIFSLSYNFRKTKTKKRQEPTRVAYKTVPSGSNLGGFETVQRTDGLSTRIRNRLLVQFKVNAVAYWLIRRTRSVGSRPGLVLGNTLSFHSAFLHRG